MFALGVIALVSNTILDIQEENGLNTWGAGTDIWVTTSFLMVRLCDAFLSHA